MNQGVLPVWLSIVFAVLLTSLYADQVNSKDTAYTLIQDKIQQQTGLKKIRGDRFITNLKYATPDNFLHTAVYKQFGLSACYVHEDVLKKLQKIEPLLREKRLKLVLFDCFRPREVQKVMWARVPDARYVADPAKGSLHNRGVAIDCALADENGDELEFPTAFDDFTPMARQDYTCPESQTAACRNREILKDIMTQAGLSAITTEWWHFQLGNPKAYQIISLDKER